MKISSFLILIIIFSSCTSVTTLITSDKNNRVVMNSTEDCLFSSPKEKLKMTFTPENGGQIYSIYWEGVKIADQFHESYPNPKMDFNKLKPRVLDDGSGLVIVDSNIRGQYQLRRSYSLKYFEATDEHIIEVIYNVKNYSAESAIKQQWIQTLSLPKSLNIIIEKDGFTGINKNLSFKIKTINIKDLTIEGKNSSVHLKNSAPLSLGTKERLSWKVLYKLKKVD